MADQGPITERYKREEELGRGGMGVVWRATDGLLKRPVAIKEIHFPPTLAEDERETMKSRVLREARSAAQLNHPSAVSVFDVIQNDGTAFIVMELVDAPTLSDIVKDSGPMSPQEAARVGSEILSALQAAHAAGIVHRDVKPANVMVPGTGPAKLADFGIASVKDDPRLTASGIVLGSPAFMAPEQGTTGKSSAASDLWGLGATLYFAVEGKPPFEKSSAVATLTAVMNEEITFSGRAGALEDTIRQLLDKDPDRRPEAASLLATLQAVSRDGSGVGPTAVDLAPTVADPDVHDTPAAGIPEPEMRPTPVREREDAPVRRRPDRPSSPAEDRRGWWVVAAIAATLAILAAWMYLGNDDPPEQARSPGATQEDEGRTGDEDDQEDNDADADADSESESGPDIPEGWTQYTDDAIGYSIAYPEGWQEVAGARNANQTDFRDPDSGTYLRVEWVQPPGDDAVAAWESSESTFSERFSDYERLQLEETELQGMPAALWEYTYSDGGADLHAYNLGFITDGEEYGMALNFQTHEADWEDSQDLWETFTATFEAP